LGNVNLIIFFVSGVIYKELLVNQNAEMSWIVLFGIDFPVLILLMIFNSVVNISQFGNTAVSAFYVPFLFFSILGTIQYYTIGYFLVKFFKKYYERYLAEPMKK